MKTAILSVMLLLAAAAAPAQTREPKTPPGPTPSRGETPSRVPIESRGISAQVYVGGPAPAFDLASAGARRVRLSSYRGTRVLLCFADRRDMLPQYRAIADSLRERGVVMVAIARDSPRSLRAMAERESLAFELLSDPTGEVSALYGSYDAGSSTIRPGYILVDPRGLVRMALLGQRLPPSDVLQITRYALAGM